MTLYFDTRVRNSESQSINSSVTWHPNLPFLAVSSYSQGRGGYVTIHDDQGETLPDVETPGNALAHVTAVAWHPERRRVVAGWENGEIKMWSGDIGNNEFSIIVTPHRSAILLLQWSQFGSRLVSADANGSMVGWMIDSRGQLLMMFHHELQDTMTHVAFKISPPKPAYDNSGAVIQGDAARATLFTSWRPRTAAPPTKTVHRDNPAFYVSTSQGMVYFVDVEGQCIDVLDSGGLAILCMLHHQTRDCLVVMTAGVNIGYFQANPENGKLVEITKVKLSNKGDLSRSNPGLCWVSTNTLAILTGELAVRCWDLHTGDTYVLSPPEPDSDVATPQEICTSLSFCKKNETLAAGTNLGNIYLWKRKLNSESEEKSWPTHPESCAIHATVKQVVWGAAYLRNPLLAVNCITNVFILHQQALCAIFNDGVSVCQFSPTQLQIEYNKMFCTLKTDLQIQLLAVNKNYILTSTGRTTAVYKLIHEKGLSTTVVTSFNCDAEKILIHESTIIVLTPNSIQLKSVEGSLIQTLPFASEEGEPITMDLTGSYLTVATLNGILKVWDLSKREGKLHTKPISAVDVIDDFAEIIEAKCNSNCSFISITVAMANLMPSSILYVWDVENDRVHEFDFDHRLGNEEDNGELVSKCRGRLITAHFWDNDDSRLLVCRAQRLEGKYLEGENANENSSSVVIVTMFVTSEKGIVVQDIRGVNNPTSRLLSVESPKIMILTTEHSKTKVERLLMRDFEDLEDCDAKTKAAILDFCCHLSLANMDEAFKSIKSIQNEAVWKSLAKMCVTTKQLDMAMLCLGHMKKPRSTRALREAMQDDGLNVDARAGILAVELQLYKDAERLFRQAKRPDLTISLLQNRSKYKEAIEFAATENKIREKTCFYTYAQSLEVEGEITKAIEMYTKADCHRFEVPRMLLASPRELQTYLRSSDDPEIVKWHAQYVESTGDLDGALQLYESAQDTLSMTRLLCFLGKEEEACDLVAKTNHAASAYHLAAHYDSKNNIPQAINYYTTAKAYTNAIRICKENDMMDELWPLATLAPPQFQIDVAKYYEENNQSDRAILLYHKAGFLRKALDLAFKTQQYNALQLIAMDVNADSDPTLIEKCADYFIQNEQIEKAVDLLAMGKKYLQALELIQNHNISLTEEMAEKMTVDKVEKDLEQERTRLATLEKIGEVALDQGNYHLATKKFTQAGNKFRAMKALLKSGDTEKICFFAQVSRQRDIYIMAANYLQSLDWQNQADILKNIITFYSKGKAMDLLANFYVACAQVEIDDFQNYEKALDALSHAAKCLAKVTEPRDAEIHKRAIDMVNARIATIKKYLDIKRLFEKGETESGLSHVRHLIDSQGADLEQSVRRGDLFATITQHYVKLGQLDKAYASVEELKRLVPDINLSYYFDPKMLEALGFKRSVKTELSSDNEDAIEELLGD